MANIDIFGSTSTQSTTTVIRADQMILSLGNGDTINAMLQNITISYSRPMQTLREIGSKNYYYVSTPSQGQLSIARLVSESKKILDIIGDNAWALNRGGVTATLTGGGLTYTLHNCVVSSFVFSAPAEAKYVQEQVSITFTGLDMSQSEDSGGGDGGGRQSEDTQYAPNFG